MINILTHSDVKPFSKKPNSSHSTNLSSSKTSFKATHCLLSCQLVPSGLSLPSRMTAGTSQIFINLYERSITSSNSGATFLYSNPVNYQPSNQFRSVPVRLCKTTPTTITNAGQLDLSLSPGWFSPPIRWRIFG